MKIFKLIKETLTKNHPGVLFFPITAGYFSNTEAQKNKQKTKNLKLGTN